MDNIQCWEVRLGREPRRRLRTEKEARLDSWRLGMTVHAFGSSLDPESIGSTFWLEISRAVRVMQGWGSCKGSKKESRGYTCGLWLTFHSMAARVHPESTGGAFWLAAVRCGPGLHRP